MNAQEFWRFETENFALVARAEHDPDCDLSWCEPDDLAKIDNGEWLAFVAVVEVLDTETGETLAGDCLGGCVYTSLDAFRDHHGTTAGYSKDQYRDAVRAKRWGRAAMLRRHAISMAGGVVCGSYFSDMVRNACHGARAEVARRRDRYATLAIRATAPGAAAPVAQ